MKKKNTGHPVRAASSRVLVSIGLAVSMLISLVGFGTTAALAHGPGTNGCTAVPDSGYGFNFHDLCDSHDRCYSTKPYGFGSWGRKACDRTFRAEMFQYCKRHRFLSSKRFACNAVAGAYYLGVRIFGYQYWQADLPTPIA